jgi:hypothetical protein
MRSHLIVTALGLVALSATTAKAQSEPKCHRCLNGFRFMPSSVVDDPFATTFFQNSTGGGSAANFKVPVRNLAGDTLTSLSGNVGFLLVDFEYQQAIAKWLALRVSAGGIGRLGTSIPSLVATGVSAAFGAAFGATVPIVTRSNFIVSAVADFRSNTQYDVDPFGFAEQVADSMYDPESKSGALLSSYPVNRWSVGLRGAWGIAPWVGVSGELEPGGAHENSANKSLTTYGALVGFDFAKRHEAPIGLSLGYRGQSGSGKTGNIAGGYRTVQGGVYYTGRPDFQIGSDIFWSKIAVASDGQDLDGVQFRLVTRIDF